MKNRGILLVLTLVLIAFTLSAQRPTIRMDSVRVIGSHKAKFSCFLSSKGSWANVKKLGFMYAPVTNPQVGDTVIYTGSNTAVPKSFSVQPTGTAYYLRPNTQYWVKALVTTGTNAATYDTAYSDTMCFRTRIDTLTTSVMDSATDIQLISARLIGRTLVKGDCESIAGAGIILALTPNPTHDTPGVIELPVSGNARVPGTINLPVNNILSGRTYYARVYVKCKYSNACIKFAYSDNQINFTTRSACGTPPFGLDTISVGVDQVDLKWRPSQGQVEFEIDYGFSGHEAGQGTLVRASDTTKHITGLTSNRTYTAFVRAVCGELYSDWSVLKSFRTREADCERISGLHSEYIDYFTVKIVWSPGTNEQDKWDVLLAKKSENYPSTSFTVEDQPQYVPVGLNQNTDYKVKVRAHCPTANSVWSEDLEFRTTSSGLEDNPNNNTNYIMVYPNPSTGIIKLTGKTNNIDKVEIYSLLGTLIYSHKGDQNTIDLTGTDKGLYIMYISTNTGVQIEKILLN